MATIATSARNKDVSYDPIIHESYWARGRLEKYREGVCFDLLLFVYLLYFFLASTHGNFSQKNLIHVGGLTTLDQDR